ncbi:hypothetical protein BOTBODRAFT_54750 [Botryobasidium botryosum FD-172 SS1]|uniref:Pre-mRNA-splicing factor ISY1 n=1 Tax=Botryobasidium botryosum (strain FD-172 SS1) TaxID=930990 RepID=A0A067ML82_BOTB1|nr:hypothetical protein BOTBODRAFT_54750 [Botryobasidium botryosum FD-172 SS1]
MLYRFREAQAAELGLARKGDKRPRMASACKSLRDCERWRGEILREISRKVSKIQDAGLTDYEIRDLNDEINKLMREKRHWENQIVALGGANYRRNVAMLDDDGKEVPGTRGYKYFGRAKELPGVKELFAKSTQADEENQIAEFYKKFTNQGPGYFGDLDETDGALLDFEKSAEEAEWEDAYATLREVLQLPASDSAPVIPRPDPVPLSALVALSISAGADGGGEKRKLDGGEEAPQDEDAEMADENAAKRSKSSEDKASAADSSRTSQSTHLPLISILTMDDLAPPKMPTREEMEEVLLGLRKRALLEEYLGTAGEK